MDNCRQLSAVLNAQLQDPVWDPSTDMSSLDEVQKKNVAKTIQLIERLVGSLPNNLPILVADRISTAIVRCNCVERQTGTCDNCHTEAVSVAIVQSAENGEHACSCERRLVSVCHRCMKEKLVCCTDASCHNFHLICADCSKTQSVVCKNAMTDRDQLYIMYKLLKQSPANE